MFSIIDIESTGGGFKGEKIIDISIFLFDGEKIVDSYSTLINPGIHIPSFITKLTGIKDSMVADAPYFEDVLDRIDDFTKDAIFVAHNVQYDYGILKHEFRRLGRPFLRKKMCTIKVAKKILPNLESYSLGKICENFKIEITDRHRAKGDARATVSLFSILLKEDKENLINSIISEPYNPKNFAPNVSIDEIIKLPEDTGVYYFHDKFDKVIYIGKSNIVKDRVIQHLEELPINKDKQKMYESVHSVTCRLTGSELLSLLFESYDIMNLAPKYNKRQRPKSRPYGIVRFTDANGYHNIKVKKLVPEDEPLAIYSNARQAKLMIENCITAYQLCPKLCGKDKTKKACFNYPIGKCEGACIGKEKASYYNAKLEEALSGPNYEISNFLIVGEGRNFDEASVIGIFGNRFYGYGFFEKDKLELNLNREIKSKLKRMPQNQDADKIITSYLNKNKFDTIVPLKKKSKHKINM